MSGFMGDVKSVASSLWRKSRQGVDKLANSIDEKTEVAKLNAKISRLNKERGELITEMGRKVYALHRRDAIRNKDLLADCKRVDEIVVAVDQLQAQIEELRVKEPAAAPPPEIVDVTPVEDVPEEPQTAEETVEPAAPEAAPEDEDVPPVMVGLPASEPDEPLGCGCGCGEETDDDEPADTDQQ